MNMFSQDLRFGWRMLRRSPGFAVVALLTLALGIGANTAIFSFVNGVLLRPLPYQHPERICMVWEKPPQGERNGISTLNYLDWVSQNTVFDHMAAQRGDSLTLSGSGKPVQLRAAQVSASFFEIFGVRAAMGRTFAKGEDERGKGKVAILSDRLWRSQFGAARDILGKTIALNREPYTVIGVLPASSPYDRTFAQIWTPLVFEPRHMTRNFHWFRAYARLKEGVTVEQARAEMKVIGARIEKLYPDSNKGWSVTVDRFTERVVGDQLRHSLYVLLGAVGAVLLIGCANLANLTLARGTSREREAAIRASLGASRWRLVRQFLTENVLLSLLGGLVGLAFGYAMMAGLRVLTPPFTLPAEADVSIDMRVLLFTLGISLFTGIVFGLAPALQAARPNLAGAMKDGGRGSTGGKVRGGVRTALIIAETALAVVLLSGAGLLLRSFDQMQRFDTGFDGSNVLTMGLPLSPRTIEQADQADSYTRRVLEKVAALPGIRYAAISTALPLQGWGYGMPFQIAGQAVKDHARRDACFFKMVSPDYFSALGIPIRRGRSLSARDVKGTAPVAIVNETMVKKYFKDRDPLGQRIEVQEIIYGKPTLGAEIAWQVIGVIADERVTGIEGDPSPGMYVPYSQSPTSFVSLLVKGNVNPEPMQGAIARAVQQMDSEQALPDVKTIDTIRSESVGANRLRTTLLAVFAGIAMLLAAIGIYGVVSWTVAQRTAEIGLRAALGASRGNILALVLRTGMLRIGLGLLIGLAGSFAVGRVIKSLLFQVGTWDPAALIASTTLLAVAGVTACLVPARRATRVDPLVALRYE